MKKSRVTMISCASVAAVAAVVGVVLASMGFGKASEAGAKTERAWRDLKRVYERDPFPSRENIETARTNVQRRTAWTAALAKAIDEGTQPAARNVTPGAFSQMREKAIERMAAAAPTGEDGNPVVSEGFAFGFERYASGIPAEKHHVERLVRQLRLMETLVGIVYDAGIVHLDAVGREAFEDATPGDGADDVPDRRRGRRGGGAVSGTGSISVPALSDPEGPVELRRDRFALQFSAKEAALVSVLDALDSMRPFAMVTSLSIDKIRPDVVFPEEAEAEKRASQPARDQDDSAPRRPRRRARGTAEEDFAAVAQAAAPVLNERPAPRSARLVSGPLRESPVRATIYLDVFSVPSARAASAAGVSGEDGAASGEEED